MNEQEFQKLIGEAKQGVRLRADERPRMREDLVRFMSEHPVRKVAPHSSSPVSALRTHKHKKDMMIGILIAVLLGGSTAFAAEGALPGDILYPVKVHVNEEVRAAATIGAEADARWEARRVERRLEEARELEAEGRLDAEMRAELGSRISANAQAFAQEAKELREDGKKEEAKAVRAEFVNLVHAEVGVLGIEVDLDDDTRAEIEDEDEALEGEEADEDENRNEFRATTSVDANAGARQGGTRSHDDGEIRLKTEANGEVEIDDDIDVDTRGGVKLGL